MHKYIYKIKYYEYNNNTEINHNITFILIKQVSDKIHKLPYYTCNYRYYYYNVSNKIMMEHLNNCNLI